MTRAILVCHVFSCPFLLLGALATSRLRAPAPVCLSHPPAPFFWDDSFSSHPPAVTSYDVIAPTPHGLGPAAPLLVALSFGHSAISYYTTAVYNVRSALETGRPATSGNRLSIPHGQVVPRWSAGGASSAQGETAVTPVFDSDACHSCVSRVFLPFSAAWGARYVEAPGSRTCLSFSLVEQKARRTSRTARASNPQHFRSRWRAAGFTCLGLRW